MRLKFLTLILATSTALTGCSGGERSDVQVGKQLTVWGSQVGLTRFVKLQGSLRPALAVSTPKSLGNGRAEATVTFPVSYKGEDLVHRTREALTAGLSYKYEERHTATAVRS